MQLYNTLSAEERAKLIDEAGKERLTLSFYAYAKIEDPKKFRDELFIAWNALDALGRIYVANEGINAQMSVPADHFEEFRNTLEAYDFMKGIRLNVAVEQDNYSFLKLTIKVRHKIVADGLNDDSFDVTNKGVHLKAQEFNDLLEDPNTIVVDFRNHYESEVGHFEGAITPDVENFRESLPIINEQLQDFKEDKNLLMYCTGGIRCEKASAYFKHQGFKNVYQLEGGIIEYTRQIKEEGIKSKFIGKNFVFDHRLGERITDDIISQCHQCGKPCDNHTNCANDACHLLFIQCDECKAAMENCCSTECLEITHLPLEEQVALRKGLQVGNKVFRKGKSDALKFKNSGDLSTQPLGKVTTKPETKDIRQKIKVKKTLIGKAEHYYSKSKIAQFLIENKELSVGDKVLISGPTTGDQEIVITQIHVNGGPCETAKAGDQITFELPFRVRLSDKLYKIVQA
ncbi:rhodanese-related sulfurtransferase [Elizabethkingia anophelis]|uniref:oxygen-dependent tRNA uridine(34) hydroxylase TrhO n=1 Tax=Elizabethkingia anophelis TaxID=1117645 RepID=UPI001367E3C6|nr:rhodanese-related sulfurtransferase [Elizabethkingia anophelis]MCT3804733.1 rhodanese-related sulfurtransferase [Elizabethkingia anophelis]MCT3811628.1 rhodanese-related sulfurtransferase [Elizabethkingia anophelis]MCT3819015.1 rhodanese-related sulfurtransferase [Elizabethkingia anophelis]MCT3941095.1 rhodanese-related sulfurtransferase [Elizabethkingia anophelis]MCT4174303.1 rhodanese-related sulfurtransferase [Elizabethkingia anophelis]